jgi:hypothetical protein
VDTLFTDPDSTCRMVTAAPGTALPSTPVTLPPTAEVVFCAWTDIETAASAAHNTIRAIRRTVE